ncbi:hypothetical protein IFM47457_03679 [Aspergillus lentulus]|nr:hypothetical protein IFM47457_03679 [Aspergillus lentulus]
MSGQDHPSASPGIEHGLRKSTRYITGLDATGKDIILASPDLRYHDRGGYAIARLYQLEKVPADIQAERDMKFYLSGEGYDRGDGESWPQAFNLVTPRGANFVQGDFGPSAYTVWHRTVSVDFVTVVEGELTLMVGENDENCSKMLLKQGDSVIQRGTLHKWVNPSSEKPARFVATLLASEPFNVGEKVVEPVWIPKSLELP